MDEEVESGQGAAVSDAILAGDASGVESEAPAEAKPERVEYNLAIDDAGPCRKRLRVTIPRTQVDHYYNDEFKELIKSASIPGFRPGKTPRKLVERRFRKDVADRVKATLLMRTLEQIGDDKSVEPISEPDIDFESIELPEEGDFAYEFEVEVRPEFELPNYKGMRLQRPARTIPDEEVDKAILGLRRQKGTAQAKDGPVALGDYIETDIRFLLDNQVINEVESLSIEVKDDLLFRDGRIDGFGKGMIGASAGDTREFKAKLARSFQREELRGIDCEAIFVIKEVKTLEPAPVDDTFLQAYGIGDLGELRDLVRTSLEIKFRQTQNEALVKQIVEQLLAKAQWDLPRDMLRRQATRAMQRRIVEYQSAGFSEDEIRGRMNTLSQDVIASAATSLKEQFLLERIAEEEKIEVTPEDIDAEIDAIAQRSGESSRRVRARIEKEGLGEAMQMQLLQRRTVERILSYAQIDDVAYTPTAEQISSVDESAVPEALDTLPSEADLETTGDAAE